MKQITATEAELVVAFTEWGRRFRDPAEETSNEEFGQNCATYLIALLEGEI